MLCVKEQERTGLILRPCCVIATHRSLQQIGSPRSASASALFSAPAMATDVVSSPVEAGLTLFLVQVFIILILVRALASLLKAMHQPVRTHTRHTRSCAVQTATLSEHKGMTASLALAGLQSHSLVLCAPL